MKFQVVGGHRGPGGAMSEKEVEVVEKGGIVESDKPLDELFPNAYIRVEDKPKPKKGKSQPKAEVEEDPDEDDEFDRPDGMKAGKPKAKKGRPAKEAVKETEEESDDEDVTEQYSDAGKNDLKVTKSKDGMVVKDGKKTVTEKPLKTKKQVEAFLAKHLTEESEDED